MIDDSLTRSVYKGLCLQQRQEVMNVFSEFLRIYKPKSIIEIGTGHGGLTMYLRDNTNPVCELHTFDIAEKSFHSALTENNINIYYQNIFKEVRDWNKFEIKEEWLYLFNESPKLVICDGGQKKAEFNGIAHLLKPNDIIMLHDYSTDQQTFDKLDVWNWLECQYSDIKNSVEQHNLHPFMHEEFLGVAWGCFIKK